MFDPQFLKKSFGQLFDYIFSRRCLLCGDVLFLNNDSIINQDSSLYLCKKCNLEIYQIDQDNCCCKCGYPFEPVRFYKNKIIRNAVVMHNKRTICQNCKSMHFVFEKAKSCFQYYSKIRKLLLNFKFYFQTEAIDFIGMSLMNVYKNMKKADIVCCVPIERKKLFLKGYNHSALMAGSFFKFIKQTDKNIIFLPDLVVKKKFSEQSKKMSYHERLSKKHNFSINKKYLTDKWKHFFNNKTILIIDDIMTTGSTLNASASTLKQVFFNSKIECLTFARTMLY